MVVHPRRDQIYSLRLRRGLVQPPSPPLLPGLPQPRPVRTTPQQQLRLRRRAAGSADLSTDPGQLHRRLAASLTAPTPARTEPLGSIGAVS